MALPLDELEIISKKLTFAPDYTRFRSVCKAWRSAAPKHRQLPWLIATVGHCIKFYQFSFEANKFTEIPELSAPSWLSSLLDKPHVFIKSSHGWLFLLDLHTKSVSLINPVTGSIINLPNLHIMVNAGYINHNEFGFCLSLDPGESFCDCFALVYYSGRIYYCKVGSSAWSEMLPPGINMPENIHMYCYRGKLFLVLGGDVFVCKFGDNPSVCKLVSLRLKDEGFHRPYFVESDGELLLVLVLDDLLWRTYKVFKLKFGQQQVKLVVLKCLGDRALFLGQHTAFSLVASKYPGCKKNSLYIPHFVGCYVRHQIIAPTLIRYDCEKKEPTVLPYPVGDCPFICCAWFTPSLLMYGPSHNSCIAC